MNTITIPTDVFLVGLGFFLMLPALSAWWGWGTVYDYKRRASYVTPPFFPGFFYVIGFLIGAVMLVCGLGHGFYMGVK